MVSPRGNVAVGDGSMELEPVDAADNRDAAVAGVAKDLAFRDDLPTRLDQRTGDFGQLGRSERPSCLLLPASARRAQAKLRERGGGRALTLQIAAKESPRGGLVDTSRLRGFGHRPAFIVERHRSLEALGLVAACFGL
jgi:hypothetical protein